MIATMTTTQLRIEDIRMDGGTQSRTELDQDKITEYAQLMLEGIVFPSVIVFYDGVNYWLAEGFHRCHSSRRINREVITVEVKQGTRREAVLYAMEANTRHGIPLPLFDRKRCARTMLEDEEWREWSDREIGRRCGLSHDTVGVIRKDLYGDFRQNPANQPVERVEEVETVRIRTQENDQEKRDRVEKVLIDSPDLSSREIARQCDVSEGLVRTIRAELKEQQLLLPEPTREPSSKLTVIWDELEQSQTIERVYEQTTEEDIDDIEIKAQKLARWQRDNIDLGLDEWGNPLPKQILADREEGRVELSDGTVVIKTKNNLPEEIIASVVEPESVPAQAVVEEPEPDVVEVIASVQEQPQITVYVDEEEGERRDAHVMRVMGSSDSPEWYTPRAIIQMVNDLMGEIELDPCSNSHESPNVLARNRYTKEDDGLSQQWTGKTYLNPPYGPEIVKWVNKLVDEHERGNVSEAIALLPGRIDTNWFQPLYKYLICNIHGRIQFENSPYHAPFPCVIVYMGERTEDFIAAFKQLGPIMRRVG